MEDPDMMFATYEDPANGRRKLVKLGFSWPGLFLGPVWALARGMWARGILSAVVVGDLAALLNDNRGLTASLGLLPLGLAFGLFGNRWLSESLERRGYAYKGSQYCE